MVSGELHGICRPMQLLLVVEMVLKALVDVRGVLGETSVAWWLPGRHAPRRNL
jgi:hypothetical protein